MPAKLRMPKSGYLFLLIAVALGATACSKTQDPTVPLTGSAVHVRKCENVRPLIPGIALRPRNATSPVYRECAVYANLAPSGTLPSLRREAELIVRSGAVNSCFRLSVQSKQLKMPRKGLDAERDLLRQEHQAAVQNFRAAIRDLVALVDNSAAY